MIKTQVKNELYSSFFHFITILITKTRSLRSKVNPNQSLFEQNPS